MKLAVFLAEGFEEIEALTVVDYLKRVDIDAQLISTTDSLNVTGAHGIEVVANKLLEDIDILDYQGLIIPGGLPGATNLQDDENVIDMVRIMDREGRLVAAICAGPIVLQEADIIDGRNITSFPGLEDQLPDGIYVNENVVIDGNIITARGPAIAVQFTLSIAEYLKDKATRMELEEDILYRMMMEG